MASEIERGLLAAWNQGTPADFRAYVGTHRDELTRLAAERKIAPSPTHLETWGRKLANQHAGFVIGVAAEQRALSNTLLDTPAAEAASWAAREWRERALDITSPSSR